MSPVRCLEAFITDVCGGKTNETPATYRSKLMRLIRWMEARRLMLPELRLKHVEQFRLSMIEQQTVIRGKRAQPGRLSPFTIHTVMRTVKHFLRWAYLHKRIRFDPTPLRIPPPPRPDPKPIAAEHVMALLLAASRHGQIWERARNLAMIYMLRDTAGRIGAILNADIDNLDLHSGRLDVREKGDTPHALYLNAPTRQAIRTWLKFRPELEPKENTLFLSQRGRRLSRSGFYSVLERLRTIAGLQGKGRTNPHAFRHAWVRDFLKAGADLSRASQIVGHSSIQITSDYYARWADGELQDAHRHYSPGIKLPIVKIVK